MAFERMTQNVMNVSGLPNVISGQATTLKNTFDKSGSDLKTFINNFLTTLESPIAATNIGADVETVATKTLQAILTAFDEAISDRYTKTEAETLISSGTNDLVANVDVNLTTGVITVTKKDGTTETFDTALEKVPATFEIVENSGKYALKVTNLDGTATQTDVTNLMNIYSFNNSDTINFEVTGEGNEKAVVANIKANSIGLDKLSLTVVSTLEGYVNTAKDSANAAKTSENNAERYAREALEYANTSFNRANEAQEHSVESEKSAQASATSATEAAKSATEAQKWAEQAGGAAGDLSGYYTKAETDAKIEEAIEGIEMPEGQGSIPKFIGTQENPIDFSDLFEGIGNATDGWYQGTKVGQCILQGYVKQMLTEQGLPLSELLDLGLQVEDEEMQFPVPAPENVEMLFNYTYAVDDSQGLSMLFLISNIGEKSYTLLGYPGGGVLMSGSNLLATKKYVDDKKQVFTATIPTTGWTTTAPYTVDVAIEGMLEADLPHITPVYTGTVDTDKAIQEAYNKLDNAKAEDGYLRVTAFNEVPTTAVPIQIEVVR